MIEKKREELSEEEEGKLCSEEEEGRHSVDDDCDFVNSRLSETQRFMSCLVKGAF